MNRCKKGVFIFPLLASLLPAFICEHTKPFPPPTITRCPEYPTEFLRAHTTFAVVGYTAIEWVLLKKEPSRESLVSGVVYWNATNLLPTGNFQTDSTETWIEVTDPCGTRGWILRDHLTEYIPPEAFCEDQRVKELFPALREAVHQRDGEMLADIISPPQKFTIYEYGNGYLVLYHRYLETEIPAIFTDPARRVWGFDPESGTRGMGTFDELVRPDLVNVFESEYSLYCNEIHLGGNTYTAEWPEAWRRFHYYSVYKPISPGVYFDWMTWVVGVDYWNNKPRIFSLSRYAWEPA